jgi:hypothetical protein
MASKESMVTAPLMILLFDWTFVFESFASAWRARWRLYVALAGTWVLLAALMWQGPRSRSTGFSTGVTPWTYLLNQAQLVVHYLRLTFWPSGLVILYGNPRALTIGDVWPQALVIVALLAAVVAVFVWRPKIGFLGVWFFITLAPTSSFVPIATEVGAERRMYLPLAAIVVLVVVGAALLWERSRQNVRLKADATSSTAGSRSVRLPLDDAPGRQPDGTSIVGFALFAVVTAALATGTVWRNREYSSAVSLARTVVSRWPTARAQHWLGAELMAAGAHDEGMTNLRQALDGDPRVHYTLGMALFKDGQLPEAIEHLRAFVVAEPLRIEVPVAHETLGRGEAATRAPDLGAFVEHCFTTTHTNKASWDDLFRNVRRTGIERTILSTDLGQTINPPVAEGFAMYAQRFLDAGFTVEEVHHMAAVVPERLLGA